MSKYIVSIPIAGAIHVEVEAESQDEAIQEAWDRVNEASEPEDVGELEWEYMNHITTGNVCHAPLNDIEANRVREDKP